jgi:hypothetical protein
MDWRSYHKTKELLAVAIVSNPSTKLDKLLTCDDPLAFAFMIIILVSKLTSLDMLRINGTIGVNSCLVL